MTEQKTTRPQLAVLPIASTDEMDDFTESFLMRWDGQTAVGYRDDMRTFMSWCQISNLDPYADITRPKLELYMRWLKNERKNMPSSVKRRIGTVRQFYEIALDDDLVTKTPAKRLTVPKVHLDLTKKASITGEEMTRLLEAAYDTDPTEYAMCCLMAYCGLRVAETCSLNVEDVGEQINGQDVLRFLAKGGEVELVAVPAVVKRALEAICEGRESGPLLIHRRLKTRFTKSMANRAVQRLSRKAGITSMKVTPHTLRHSSIVAAIDAGVPLREVQLSARHRDISTTIKLYDRGRANLANSSAHTLAEFFGTADGK